MDVGHVLDRLAGQLRLTAGEHRLVAGQKEKGVVLLGQLVELERRPRALRKASRLPDLELAKGADDDEARSLDPALGIGGLAPVVERLRAVASEPTGLRGSLHLEQAHPRPDQVDEAAGLRLLEAGDLRELLPIAGEQIGEERLGPGALRALVDAPVRGERLEAPAYLLSGQADPTGGLRPRAAPGRSRRSRCPG